MADHPPTDMSRPNTPFGTEIPLEGISARFCDGTDVATVRAKKSRRGIARRRMNSGRTTTADPEDQQPPAAPRYFIVEGRLSSGFLHFRAFLFNDILLLATPDDATGPYFLAKQVPLWPPQQVPKRCIELEDGSGFKIVADDGRKVFGGTPKSWPMTPVWVHFVDACLVGNPPLLHDINALIEQLEPEERGAEAEEKEEEEEEEEEEGEEEEGRRR